MNKQKKLTLQMTIFTVFIFTAFGIIIVTEKAKPYLSPKIDKKINLYIEKNYKNIINDVIIGKTKYKNNEFKLKVTNKYNKNLYFYVTYKDKKIKDTYNKDYKNANKLIKSIEKNLANELNSKYNNKFKIKLVKDFNNFSEQVQEKILKNNIKDIPIYNVEAYLMIKWNVKDIYENIKVFNNTLKKDNYIPNSYTFTIYDIKKKKKPLKISNINKNIIENDNLLKEVIDDIINGRNSIVLSKNNIQYEYIR